MQMLNLDRQLSCSQAVHTSKSKSTKQACTLIVRYVKKTIKPYSLQLFVNYYVGNISQGCINKEKRKNLSLLSHIPS